QQRRQQVALGIAVAGARFQYLRGPARHARVLVVPAMANPVAHEFEAAPGNLCRCILAGGEAPRVVTDQRVPGVDPFTGGEVGPHYTARPSNWCTGTLSRSKSSRQRRLIAAISLPCGSTPS